MRRAIICPAFFYFARSPAPSRKGIKRWLGDRHSGLSEKFYMFGLHRNVASQFRHFEPDFISHLGGKLVPRCDLTKGTRCVVTGS